MLLVQPITTNRMLKILDNVFAGVLGVTLIDLTLMATNIGSIGLIDEWVKILTAVLGSVYFIVSIPHKWKMQRIERKIKLETLEKLELENDKLKEEQDNSESQND